MVYYSRYRPCRLSLQNARSLIRHALAVGQARIVSIVAHSPFTLKFFYLIYRYGQTKILCTTRMKKAPIVCINLPPLGRQIKKICLSNGKFFMPKKSFPLDIKISALEYLEEGRHTLQEICTTFFVSKTKIQGWFALY